MIDLSQVPDDDLYHEWARRVARKRVYTKRPGRRKVMRPCEYCGLEFGAADLRNHKPDCPRNPRLLH